MPCSVYVIYEYVVYMRGVAPVLMRVNYPCEVLAYQTVDRRYSDEGQILKARSSKYNAE